MKIDKSFKQQVCSELQQDIFELIYTADTRDNVVRALITLGADCNELAHNLLNDSEDSE